MEVKIKVYNDRKYDIGLLLQSGQERVVHANSYTLLARDEIEFLASNAPNLFENERQLRLEDRALAAQMGFIESEIAPVMDADEIKKRLNMRPNQIKAWLDGVAEPYLLDAIFDVAMTMDLPASKLRLLQERMPDKEFIKTEE